MAAFVFLLLCSCPSFTLSKPLEPTLLHMFDCAEIQLHHAIIAIRDLPSTSYGKIDLSLVLLLHIHPDGV